MQESFRHIVRQRDMYKNMASGQENSPHNGQLAITDGSTPGRVNGHGQVHLMKSVLQMPGLLINLVRIIL